MKWDSDQVATVGVYLAVLPILAASFGGGLAYGIRRTKALFLEGRELQRLDLIFAPINVLFLDRHMVYATGANAPYLSNRLANALEELRNAKLWAAAKAVFDKKMSPVQGDAEIGSFPNSQIEAVVRAHPHLAGAHLVLLVRNANRSLYEEREDDELTNEQIALMDYAWDEYSRLDKRFKR